MPIGIMHDAVLNEPRNAWYQKRYHKRIPKIAESKWWLDAYYTEIGVSLPTPPIAVDTLPAWSFTRLTGLKTYDASVGFSGSNITYMLVSPPVGITISPTSGIITADSSVTVATSTTLTVQASNAYGFATQTIALTIAIAAPITNGTLAAWTEVQSTGSKTYNASVGFTGTSITYSLPTGVTGVSINSSTGVLTANTATVTLGAHSLVVRATNISGFAEQSLSLTIASGLTAPVTVGTIGPWAFTQFTGSQTFNAASGFSGSTITYTLQVGATGFSINGSTGVVTADTTTTGSGTKNLTVRATNGAGFAEQPLVVNITAVTAPITVGTIGPWNVQQLSGNQTFDSSVGFSGTPITYALQVGATGVSINTTTGVVTADTGATGSGTKSLTVRASNGAGFADQPLSLVIAAVTIPVVVGTLGPWNEVANTGNKTFATAGGFSGPFIAYTLVSPPAGILIDSGTGVITANTAVVSTGTTALTVRATNAAGSADQPLSFVVAIAAPILVGTLAAWVEGENTGIKTYATAGGFSGSGITYTLNTGHSGLSINSSTGVLTLNTANWDDPGPTPVTRIVRATNVSGFAEQSISITVTEQIMMSGDGVRTDANIGGTDYVIRTLTATGTINIDVAGNFDLLFCASGGSGGAGNTTGLAGGGGGGGGFKIMTTQALTVGSYLVTIGEPGAAVSGASVNGNIGGDLVAFSQTVKGGGPGCGNQATTPPATGGSGGGGLGNVGTGNNIGGSGTAGQGNNGGNGFESGTSSQRTGGGGGGAGGAGGNGVLGVSGAGGIGTTSDFDGVSTVYSPGATGAAANTLGTQAPGGGTGSTATLAATSGTAPGSGGGGARVSATPSAAGTKGVFKIRHIKP